MDFVPHVILFHIFVFIIGVLRSDMIVHGVRRVVIMDSMQAWLGLTDTRYVALSSFVDLPPDDAMRAAFAKHGSDLFLALAMVLGCDYAPKGVPGFGVKKGKLAVLDFAAAQDNVLDAVRVFAESKGVDAAHVLRGYRETPVFCPALGRLIFLGCMGGEQRCLTGDTLTSFRLHAACLDTQRVLDMTAGRAQWEDNSTRTVAQRATPYPG